MSDLRARRNERKQRYLRGLRGEKSAVSPVVATLILILIAVAAAAALYLWLVAWQGSITGGIGSPTAQYTVTIGGSTSEYPFTSTAATQFEANNSDVVISVNAGGSGAGMLAVCAGNINVGESSSLETPALLEANDACPTEPGITVTTVAYDAVDVIVPSGNDHGLVSISYDTLTYIYDAASTTAPSLIPNSINELSITGTTSLDLAPFTQSFAGAPPYTELSWSQIPAAVVGATVAGCTVTTEAVSTVAATGTTANTGAACGAPNSNDYYTAAGTASSCGFTICAGGTVAYPGTDTIVPVERSDASGTTQAFMARVLGAASSSTFVGGGSSLAAATASFTSLGFSGCGGNNLLSDCGISVKNQESGNPGVISYVASAQDSIGYASDGLARATGSGVTCQGVATAACGIGLQAPSQTAAVQPSLSSTGSIAGGVVNGGFGTPGLTTKLTDAQSYAGTRPFEWVTLQPPTGEVLRFYQWVLDSSNNQAVAGETGEVSIYSI